MPQQDPPPALALSWTPAAPSRVTLGRYCLLRSDVLRKVEVGEGGKGHVDTQLPTLPLFDTTGWLKPRHPSPRALHTGCQNPSV